MTKKLKRIDPISLAKISGLGYAAMGLLFLPIMLIMPILASFAPETGQQDVPTGVFVGLGFGFAIFMPIMYGVMGFIMGLIGAFLYNLLAGWIGGIEVEVE